MGTTKTTSKYVRNGHPPFKWRHLGVRAILVTKKFCLYDTKTLRDLISVNKQCTFPFFGQFPKTSIHWFVLFRCFSYRLLHCHGFLRHSHFLSRSGHRSILRFRWNDFGRSALSASERCGYRHHGPCILPGYLLLRYYCLDHLLHDCYLHAYTWSPMGYLRYVDINQHFTVSFFFLIQSDGWWNTEYCYRAVDNMTENDIRIKNHSMITFHGHNKTTTPVEEFWE